MALTWDDLSQFTWGELEQMELTWRDLEKLSTQELIALAQQKLERIQQLPPDTAIPPKMIPMLRQLQNEILELMREVHGLQDEVQELNGKLDAQASPSFLRRLAESILSGLILNAASWVVAHPQEIRRALLQAIVFIDKIIGT